MNEKLAAAEAAKRFAAQWSGLMKGFELLGNIGSLEQAQTDAQRRLEQLIEKELAARQKLEDAVRTHSTADDLHEKAQKDITALLAEAGNTADEIRKQANKVLDNAREEAQRIVAKAQADGKEKARLEMERVKDVLAEHRAQASQAREERNQLASDIEAKRGALATIHAAIDKLKQH